METLHNNNDKWGGQGKAHRVCFWSRDQTDDNPLHQLLEDWNTIVYSSFVGKIIFLLIIGLGMEPTTFPIVLINVWGKYEANQ